MTWRPDIQPDIRWDHSLLDVAAAIVEAEWIRLLQDEALWERELADLARRGVYAPAPPQLPQHAQRPPQAPGAPMPAMRRWLRRRWLPVPCGPPSVHLRTTW